MRPTAIKAFDLSSFAAVSAGHPVRGSVDDLSPGDVIMLQMRDVSPEEGVDWVRAARIAPPGKRKPDFLRAGDLLFTSRGARNFAVVINGAPGSTLCAPHFFIIRITKPDLVLPAYLAWFINQRPAQAYFQRSATGTSLLNIRREIIEQLAVPVPPAVRQKAIVGYDDAARQERALLRGLIRNREQQMEALAFGLVTGKEGQA